MKIRHVFLALSFLLVSSSLAHADPLPVGTQAPAFTLKVVNDQAIQKKNVMLANYFKDGSTTKLLIMSFFATYCEPCKKEIPFLQALYSSYREQGLEIFLVSTDKDQDKIDELGKIAADNQLTFPVLWDRLGIVSKRYNIERLPNVYMLGADGRVFKVNTGYDAEKGPQELHDTIRQVLGIPMDAPVPAAVAKFIEPPKVEAVPEAKPAAKVPAKKNNKKKK